MSSEELLLLANSLAPDAEAKSERRLVIGLPVLHRIVRFVGMDWVWCSQSRTSEGDITPPYHDAPHAMMYLQIQACKQSNIPRESTQSPSQLREFSGVTAVECVCPVTTVRDWGISLVSVRVSFNISRLVPETQPNLVVVSGLWAEVAGVVDYLQ